jgi:hypothetical protein
MCYCCHDFSGIEVLDCLHADDHRYSIACSNIELVGLQT